MFVNAFSGQAIFLRAQIYLSSFFENICAQINWRTFATLLLVSLVADGAIAADDFALPTVDIPGVSADSDGVAIFIAIVKFIFKIILWLACIVGGLVLVKNTVKTINKVRRDEEGKWGDVIGEIIGNVMGVIAIIAFATWIATMFA